MPKAGEFPTILGVFAHLENYTLNPHTNGSKT